VTRLLGQGRAGACPRLSGDRAHEGAGWWRPTSLVTSPCLVQEPAEVLSHGVRACMGVIERTRPERRSLNADWRATPCWRPTPGAG
jgi:hypothetical protein